ncbi:MAG: flagellar basal body P-ring formation chaperone FlgA [Vicinamibacterales bacterium]
MMRTVLASIVCLAATVAAAQPVRPADDRVSSALVAELAARFGDEASIEVHRVEASMRQAGAGSIAVVPAPQASLGAPVPFVIIGTGAGGRTLQIGRGTAEVTVRVPHARTARTLGRGALLSGADLQDVVGDPGHVPLRRLPTVTDLIGGTTRRDLGEGVVVTLVSATPPPAVRAGETVQALASVGPVQVIAELTSMDNGAPGAIVRVVNRESRRELRARVVRAGVVEVIHD